MTIKTRTCLKNPLGLAKLANAVGISPIQKYELTMDPIDRQPTDTGNIDMVEDIIILLADLLLFLIFSTGKIKLREV